MFVLILEANIGWLASFGLVGLILSGLMVALWLVSLALRDSSIVDVFWGLGFILASWSYWLLTPQGFEGRKFLICSLVSTWGLRLSVHIFLRNLGQGEDYRYVAWRQQAGDRWWWQSLFKVFLLQGALLWIISMPLFSAQYGTTSARLTWIDLAGVIVWAVGFIFEAGADWQLSRFRSNPQNRGKILDRGPWRYSRHPNYFGDALQWWAFYLIAVAAGGVWTIFSPLLMTFLLLRVSGVAMLEKKLKEGKPGYIEYIDRTNAFFPLPPKKN